MTGAVRDHVAFAGDFQRDRGARVTPGRDLTTSLRVGLTQRGWACSDPRDLAHAWQFDCRRGRWRARINVGYVPEEDRGWIIVSEVAAGLGRLLRRSGHQEGLTLLCSGVHTLLSSDPRIRTVRWFTEQEWDDPAAPHGAPTPL